MSYLLAVVTSAAVDVCRKIGLHGYFQFFGQMRQRGLARSRDDCVSLTEELPDCPAWWWPHYCLAFLAKPWSVGVDPHLVTEAHSRASEAACAA